MAERVFSVKDSIDGAFVLNIREFNLLIEIAEQRAAGLKVALERAEQELAVLKETTDKIREFNFRVNQILLERPANP